jgi:hypothetical protein
MAFENCLRVSTPRPHCLPPLFSTSREKLVFSAQKVGFKKSELNSTLSLPSGVAYRKSRFICNAREAVNEGTHFLHLVNFFFFTTLIMKLHQNIVKISVNILDCISC